MKVFFLDDDGNDDCEATVFDRNSRGEFDIYDDTGMHYVVTKEEIQQDPYLRMEE